MIKMEEKGNKVYIYVKDEDTGIDWTTIVDEAEFEWCIYKKQEAGFVDPKGSAMLDYALFGKCSIPERESPRDRALMLFDMILEEVQGRKDEVKILEALRDAIDDYLFKYAGGEEE
jgi:hypothetical protein